MPAPIDDRQISLEEIKAALAARDLRGLVERLARERNWASIAMLFGFTAVPPGATQVPLPELDAAARAFGEFLRTLSAPRRPSNPMFDEIRGARLAAGEALLARVRRPSVGESERAAARLAAELLFDAGDFTRAAGLFEELGDDSRAADAFGALGDLDKMEDALAREDRRHRAQRAAAEAMRRFETLLGSGERVAAVAAASAIPQGIAEAATAHALAHRAQTRLCRGNGVTLRQAGGETVRFAATPAVLGRDMSADVPLRDLGVSRRHALISLRDGRLVLEDAGSRTGVRLGAARLAGALPLQDQGEVTLGASCRLTYTVAPSGPLVLHGLSGLDRMLVAVVGAQPLPLAAALPEAQGLWLEFGGGVARLGRAPGVSVRVDGMYIGAGCDLLHGDVIEVRAPDAPADRPPLRLEVA